MVERYLTTTGYERFIGRDFTMTEVFPGYPSQISRGPISSIRKYRDSLIVKAHWIALRTPKDTEWTLWRVPKKKNGQVVIYQAQTKLLSEYDHTNEGGTYEFSATYAGSVEVLPEGDNLDFESVIKS